MTNKELTNKKMWAASFTASLIIAILLLAASPRLAANATANDQPSSANAEVTIDNFSFAPQTLTVPAGSTVTWTNHDDIPHTVVSTTVSSNPKSGIQTKSSPTRLQRQEPIPISAQSTPR